MKRRDRPHLFHNSDLSSSKKANMSGASQHSGGIEGMGTSLAMFGTVALLMTQWHRQASSSEDLGGGAGQFFFDIDEEELEDFVQAVPKIELHVHLDGSFDPYHLWKFLTKHPELIQCFPVEKELPWGKTGEPPLPLRQMVSGCESALEYRRLCTCRRRYRRFRQPKSKQLQGGNNKRQGTLEDMLTCFEFFLPLVYDNFTLLEELAYDFVQRQFEQNVIYTEVRYSPHLLGKDPAKSLEAITQGLRRGCQAFSVAVNQILCAICFFPEWSKDVVDLADQHRSDFPCAVVGIDIAAGETHFDENSPFRKGHYEMCQRAQELGLNITIHAGETPDSEQNVKTAIEEYGARRIGHGYRIAKRKDIIDLVRDKKIHIESCPTSSVETGGWEKTDWKHHPANAELRQHGISLSLSSDDPAVFNTSLTWQYRIALKKMGWVKSDIMNMLDAAVDGSFLNELGKEELRRKIKEWPGGENYAFQDRVHYD